MICCEFEQNLISLIRASCRENDQMNNYLCIANAAVNKVTFQTFYDQGLTFVQKD